jgi:CheY-like chemotaxis protein
MAMALIADDDGDLRAAFAGALAHGGHRVIACPDGACVLAEVRAHRPDLVIADVEMPPGMSGLDVTAAIKAGPLLADSPVIVTSAGRICAETAMAVGAMLLHKPVSARVLIAHIDAVLAGGPDDPSASGPAR